MYFNHVGGFSQVTSEDRGVDTGAHNDPLFAVWARTAAE
jgi:hypothetical protein